MVEAVSSLMDIAAKPIKRIGISGQNVAVLHSLLLPAVQISVDENYLTPAVEHIYPDVPCLKAVLKGKIAVQAEYMAVFRKHFLPGIGLSLKREDVAECNAVHGLALTRKEPNCRQDPAILAAYALHADHCPADLALTNALNGLSDPNIVIFVYSTPDRVDNIVSKKSEKGLVCALCVQAFINDHPSNGIKLSVK